MARKPSLLIQHDETAQIGGVWGKKVFVLDNAGNQITNFGSLATVTIANSLVTVAVSLPGLGANATYGNATIINTATQILPSDTTRRSLMVQNISNATIFVGTSNAVTSSNGIRLLKDDAIVLDKYDGAVFGIADATGQPVRFLAEMD